MAALRGGMRFWAVAVKSLPRTKLMSVAVMNWPVREAESSAPRRWDSRSCISSRAWKRQRAGWALQRSMRQRRPSEVSNWQRLGLGRGVCGSAPWLLFVVDAFLGIFMGNPQFEVTKQRSHDATKRWAQLSKNMVAQKLTLVDNNLLVIRMDVAGLTQRGSSCRRERVCGWGRIRKNCGKLWKRQGRRRSTVPTGPGSSIDS